MTDSERAKDGETGRERKGLGMSESVEEREGGRERERAFERE